MVPLEIVQELALRTPSKILLFVLDGLGGAPDPATGRTELEAAHLPHLDALAARSLCGLTDPIAPGITPGSGPSHLALFGYDPFEYDIGRGVLSALGIGFPMGPRDVAARINFATVDSVGLITDRRAGRISTELNQELCQKLRQIRLPGLELFMETEAGHRAAVIFRGDGLSDRLSDSDPQRVGVAPLEVRALAPEAEGTTQAVNAFIGAARELLRDSHPANAVLLRGFAKYPVIPVMEEIYKLRCAAIAVYPMYKGLARLVGMEVLAAGNSLADEIETLRQHYQSYDFFYLHFKGTDTAGEDGDFQRKAAVLEEADRYIPELLALQPEVLVVTGDHSTPAVWGAHSWHPVPFLLCSRWAIPDQVERFTERAMMAGGLGRFPAVDAMRLMMAYAGKLNKYGA